MSKWGTSLSMPVSSQALKSTWNSQNSVSVSTNSDKRSDPTVPGATPGMQFSRTAKDMQRMVDGFRFSMQLFRKFSRIGDTLVSIVGPLRACSNGMRVERMSLRWRTMKSSFSVFAPFCIQPRMRTCASGPGMMRVMFSMCSCRSISGAMGHKLSGGQAPQGLSCMRCRIRAMKSIRLLVTTNIRGPVPGLRSESVHLCPSAGISQ
mmetsp:Transcript_81631/g.228958  ORF Transcript_81631/g.228958 Transcript_81631/m.228958 type:complete len:206 (-) Transcript_81631:1338-1955(-)